MGFSSPRFRICTAIVRYFSPVSIAVTHRLRPPARPAYGGRISRHSAAHPRWGIRRHSQGRPAHGRRGRGKRSEPTAISLSTLRPLSTQTSCFRSRRPPESCCRNGWSTTETSRNSCRCSPRFHCRKRSVRESGKFLWINWLRPRHNPLNSSPSERYAHGRTSLRRWFPSTARWRGGRTWTCVCTLSVRSTKIARCLEVFSPGKAEERSSCMATCRMTSWQV